METTLSKLNIPFNMDTQSIEGVLKNLQGVSTELVSHLQVARLQVEAFVYSEAFQTYLIIGMTGSILSSAALLCFWIGWQMGMTVYHLAVWLARIFTKAGGPARISASSEKIAGSPLLSTQNIVQESTINTEEGVRSVSLDIPEVIDSDITLVSEDVLITTESQVALSTPAKSKKVSSKSPINVAKKALAPSAGMLTPPMTPDKPLILEIRDAQLRAEELLEAVNAAAKTALGADDNAERSPVKEMGSMRRKGKRGSKATVGRAGNLDIAQR